MLDWRTLEGAEPPQLPGLTTTQKNDILRLLAEFPTVIGGKLGRTMVVEHKVHVEGGQPIHQQPYQVAVVRRDVLKKELDKMLEQGVIWASTSPWASPLVMVDKKDGGIRLCVDYRKVSKMSKNNALQQANLSLKLCKCQFALKKVHYLGYVVGEGRIEPDPKKVEAVNNFKQPMQLQRVKLGHSIALVVITGSLYPISLLLQLNLQSY